MEVLVSVFMLSSLILYSGSESELESLKIVSLQQQTKDCYVYYMKSKFEEARKSAGREYEFAYNELFCDLICLPRAIGFSLALEFFFTVQALKLGDIQKISNNLLGYAQEAEDEEMVAIFKYLASHIQNATVVPLRDDRTLIFDAVQKGNYFAVKNFLQQGVKVNVCRGLNSLLTVAVDAGKCDVVGLLFDFGADPNIQCGIKPLYRAAINGNSQIIKLLMDQGARKDVPFLGESGRLIIDQVRAKAQLALVNNEVELINQYNTVLDLLTTHTGV